MTSVIPIPNPVVEPAEPITDAITDPIPAEPAAEVVVATCTRTECTRTFQQGAGRVPELVALFKLVRNTDVQKSRPLTRSEVLSHELCTTCARLATFRTYPTLGTLDLMARWAEENVARAIDRREREYAYQERQRERDLQYALKRPYDKGFVNGTLAEAKPHKPRHKKPGQRYLRVGQARAKKEQAESQKQGGKKRNKQKQGGKQKGGKGKKK